MLSRPSTMALEKGALRHRRHSPLPKTSSGHSSQVLPVPQQSSGGGGYMGQIAGAHARLAQAAAEEEQARVKPDTSRREPGELKKRWKVVDPETGQRSGRV